MLGKIMDNYYKFLILFFIQLRQSRKNTKHKRRTKKINTSEYIYTVADIKFKNRIPEFYRCDKNLCTINKKKQMYNYKKIRYKKHTKKIIGS